VSADGLVVGINTLILSQSGGNEGIGFAAPSNIVRAVYEQLKTNKRVRRGEIGVFAQTITPALSEGLGLSRQWGAILGDVYPNSPAARAGLKVGDVILSVNGKPIENGRQFDVTLYRRAVGDQVTLEVARRLQRLTIRVPVVERRDDPDRFGDLVTAEKNLVPRIGILGLDFTPELAQVIPGLRDPHGVVVAAVATESADGGEIVPGDVIHALNGTGILTLADLRKGIAALAPASAAVLQVERRGQYRFVTIVVD
jgi:serine protease Do